MAKSGRPMYSARKIGLSTHSKGKLIIVGECVIGGGVENGENRKNRKRFCLLGKNRWCYDETDTTVGFSASNRSIYILKREANNRWRMCYGGGNDSEVEEKYEYEGRMNRNKQ